MAKRVHRKVAKTKSDREEIRAIRDSFQENRPTESELLDSGEYQGPMSMGHYLDMRSIGHALKAARVQANMSLADASKATGMDRGTISRIENSVRDNMTIQVINRLALAYGKRVAFTMENETEVAQ